MIAITYTDTHGRERVAEVSESFPHQGMTGRGVPLQVTWEWDWTEVPFNAPNSCCCEQCAGPIRGGE